MLIYWVMLGMTSMATLALGDGRMVMDRRATLGLVFAAFAFTIIVGLRFQIGTDWFNYQRSLNIIRFSGFAAAVGYKDVGFGLISWLSLKLGLELYGVNIVCAAMLMAGLVHFVKRQPDPWLAMTAAVPYLIIVVGMGYIRQAAAIGMLFYALTAYRERRLGHAVAWLMLGAVFHASIVIMLPIAALAISGKRLELLVPFAIISVAVYVFFLADRLDTLYDLYLGDDVSLDSAGAAIRVLINAAPAAVFLIYRRQMETEPVMRMFWTLVAIISLALVPAVFLTSASTAIDRIALYFIPLQILVFGRVPFVVTETSGGAKLVTYGCVLYFSATLYAWLNFAANSRNWVPYAFAPFAGGVS